MTQKEKATLSSDFLSTLKANSSNKPRSLRKAINEKCRSCVFDKANKGNWRQQVTLCSDHECELYLVRPVSGADIPESILNAYNVPEWERSRFAGPRRSFLETNPPPNTPQDTHDR